jgi:myo-inositol 2-dehydrogenase/D-chiro-inositol 1-dehydrogenase
MSSLKIAIAGLGRIGKIHLHNLSRNFPDTEVVAAYDPDKESRIIADQYGIPDFKDDFEGLLTVAGLDAVVICSPTDTHSEYVIRAAKAGKHIFCEKPLDLSLERVKEVLEIVEQSKVQLMLGFNRRFDPEFARIREIVMNGEIGDPQILKITSRDPAPPPVTYIKSSGGMFLDMTIHDFDMARFITGKEVTEVYAAGAVMVDKAIGDAGDIDSAVITLIFEDGSLGVIDNSRKAVYGYDQRLEIFGSKGMATADNNYPNTHRLYTEAGISGDLPLHFFLERYMESYKLEMEEFISALRSKGAIKVIGEDGLKAMIIGMAARLSSEENRPVNIKEIGNNGV